MFSEAVADGRGALEMEINGVAHVMLTVAYFEACSFYEKLLTYLGMKPVMRGEDLLYCVGGRRRVGNHARRRFASRGEIPAAAFGLHHVCLRARQRSDIDEIYGFLRTIGAKIVHAPEDGPWAPGYYSVLFEDPDGIRLEVNHVPGKGLLGLES